MKLSYRDKVIFICAIVVIILVAGFFLFIKPKYDDMGIAKSQLQTKQSEKQAAEDKINTLPQLVEQLKGLAESVKDTQAFFLTEQDPYLNEQFLYDILKTAGVDVQSIETAYTVAGDLSEYVVAVKNVNSYDLLIQGDLYNELPQEVYDNYNKVTAESGQQIIIGITEVSIGYTDNMQLSKVFKFIDTIADDERTMSVLSISSAEDNGEETEATGSISMRLYSIFPLNVDKVMEETDEIEIVPVEETAAETPAA